MIRNITLFAVTFVLGALIALVVRAAWFDPHRNAPVEPAVGGDYAPMVSNALAPAAASVSTETPPSAASAAAHAAGSTHAPADTAAHHDHAAPASPAAPESAPQTEASVPVNIVCAICGMEVDPKIPTAVYQGKTIGFGCRMCPPKFKADPDRYGPYYLRNEVIKR